MLNLSLLVLLIDFIYHFLMTFEKKTFEYVFASTFSNFKINSCKALIKRLSKKVI